MSRIVARSIPLPDMTSSNVRSVRASESSYERIEIAARRVGPLHRLPARVDRHQPAEADVLNLPRRELRVDRLAGRRFLELPEELRQREQLRPRDAGPEVDAVDAEVGQLAQNLGLRLAVVPEGDAVEMGGAVDDVDAQRGRVSGCAAARCRRARPASARWPDGRRDRVRSDGAG